jgi:hypothetical protein
MLDQMNKNRPQAGNQFNAMNPTGGQVMAGNQAAVSNQAAGAANIKAGLHAMHDQTFREANSAAARAATQQQIAAIQSQFARGLMTWQDYITNRAAQAQLDHAEMARAATAHAQIIAARMQLDRGNVVTSEMMAEQRKMACDRMGEPRCSTRCYTARRHVEPEPKKTKTGWRRAQDQMGWVAKLPNTMARDIPTVEIEGAGRIMSACSALPDPPSRGYGKVEHENAHLRPRWR